MADTLPLRPTDAHADAHAPAPVATTAELAGLLTTAELAELLRVTRRCIERWTAAGRIPGRVQLPGRVVRWRRALVLAWLEAGCPAPARPRKGR